MMLQAGAASRQSPALSTVGHHHCHRRPHQQHQQQHHHQHHKPVHPAYSAEELENLRSGRLASALLFLSVLVLMVDASRIILYSWYTDGSYLKYLYGNDAEIRWPKCDDEVSQFLLPPEYPPPPSTVETSTPSAAMKGVVVITAALSQPQPRQQQPQEDQQLDQFKDSLLEGLGIAGGVLDAAVSSPGAPRRVPKQLVRILFHASTAACLFFLAIAVFPAALRVRRRRGGGCCVLALSIVFSLATLAAAGASVSSSLLSVYFFGASEVVPSARRVYDFVPRCSLLRRGFLGAECFSLIVICASVCLVLHLKAYFCRALCDSSSSCCLCCCCFGGSGDGGGCWCCSDGCRDANYGDGSGQGDGGGGGGGEGEYELARPGRRHRQAGRSFEEEEYLA